MTQQKIFQTIAGYFATLKEQVNVLASKLPTLYGASIIFLFLTLFSCVSKDEQKKGVESKSLYSKIAQLGKELIKENKVPGISIAVIRNGKLNWIQTIGYADLESKRPVNKETIFNVGSISKMVSAWGFMQMVENGVIGLDDPVNNHLTRWKLPESKFNESGVTPRRLMSHTAGISLHSVPGFEAENKLPTLEESLSSEINGSEAVNLVLEPGSKWQYSGGGYAIMQLLLEEKTNIDFATYMKKNVFEPLGMANTDYRWTEDIAKKAARPYDENGNPLRNKRFAAVAAAGLQTNIEDLVKFAELSINKDPEKLKGVLKAETIDLMQKTVLPTSDEGESGLGYYKTMKYGLPIVGHGGSNPGWVAQVTLHLPTKSGLVIMCNGSNGLPVRRAIFSAWVEEVQKQDIN